MTDAAANDGPEGCFSEDRDEALWQMIEALCAARDRGETADVEAFARERPELAEERLRIKFAVTGRLNWVLAEASTAWEKSKEPVVTEEVDERGVVRRRTSTGAGNPQFLREFRAANADLIELWNVRGTIQHEGQSDRHVESSQMTDEEFEASIAAARQTRDRRIQMRKAMEAATGTTSG